MCECVNRRRTFLYIIKTMEQDFDGHANTGRGDLSSERFPEEGFYRDFLYRQKLTPGFTFGAAILGLSSIVVIGLILKKKRY